MNGNGDSKHSSGNLTNLNGSNNNNGLNGSYERYEITVRHHLGKGWSTFLGMYISNLFRTSIVATETNYEVSTKTCFVYVNMAMKDSN